MIKTNEGDSSPSVRNFQQSASVNPEKMVQADLSGAEISREQAPRKRGLLGPFQQKRPLLGSLASVRQLMLQPQLRVWGPVLAKAAGAVGMLSCVALLGFHSRAEDTYGAVATASLSSGILPSATEAGAQPPDKTAAASEPVQPEAKKQPAVQCPVPPPCQEKKPQAAGIAADGKIILNEASADELTRLPGVGQARAEAIVALRERLKGFRKVSDLLRIRGIGFRTLEKMKDQIILDRPPAEEPEKPEQGDPVAEKG